MSQLTRNILTLYAARAVSIVAGVALFPFIAAQVGLEAFGVWLLISSVTVFFSTTDFGLGTSAIRYVARAHSNEDHDEINRVLCSTLACFVVLGALLAAGYVGVFALLWDGFGIPARQQDAAKQILAIVAVSTLLLGMPLYVFRQVLAAIGRYDAANALLLTQTLLRVGLIAALLLAGRGIVAVAVAEAFAGLTTSLAAVVWCRRLLPALRIHPSLASFARVREMAPYSAQVFVMGIAALVILETDTIVIGLFLPIAMVTLYAGAFRIYKTCRDLTQSIMQAVIPDASRALASGDRSRVGMLLLRGSTFANVLVLGVAVPVMTFAQPLLTTWAGPEFDAVVGALLILMGGLLVNNQHIVAVGVLTGMGRIGAYTRLHVAWALANLGISVALVGPLGLEGVALGSVLPLIVLEPLYIRIALRETGVSPRAFLRTAIARPYGCAALAAVLPLALLIAGGPTVAMAICGTLGYLAIYALALSRGLHRDQRRMLRRLIPVAN